MRLHHRALRAATITACVLGAAACGGSDGPTGNGGGSSTAANIVLATTVAPNATAGTAVTPVPVFRVTNAAGSPVAGAQVRFSITGGGSIGATVSSTDAQGLASPVSWLLGPTAGVNTLSAAVGELAPATVAITTTGGSGGLGPSCATTIPYTLLETITGSITRTDCLLVPENTFADQYTFTAARSEVEFRVASAQFDAFIYVLDSLGNIVGFNDDVAQGNLNATARMMLTPGRYSVIATPLYEDSVGTYTFSSVAAGPITNCGSTAFTTVGATSTQSLATTDCRATDGAGNAYYGDEIGVILPAGRTITITMSSTALDPYLELWGANGRIAENDDISATNLNARLTYTAPASSPLTLVVIVASSALPLEQGAYTISIQ